MRLIRNTLPILLAFACVCPARGAVFLSGGEYPIMGDTEGHQKNPHLALNQSGGFAVWQNSTADSGGERVVGQKVSVDHMGMGSIFVISQNIAAQNEVNPKVALLNDGGAVVVWQAGPRNSQDVYARFLDDKGQFQSSIIRVNTHDEGVQSSPSVAVSEDGKALVVWDSEGVDGSGLAICGQLFDSLGTKVGSEFRINQAPAGNQSLPVVAEIASDKFIVGWLGESVEGRNSSGAPNFKCNLMARIVNDLGSFGNEFRLNSDNVIATEVQIISLEQGGFAAAWTQKDEQSTRNITDIYANTYDSAGLPQGVAKRINTHLPGAQNTPVLVAAGDAVMVGWVGSAQDAGGLGVRGRLLSGGAEFGINSQGNLDQSMPALADNGEGSVLAIWVNTIKADHSILSAQRFRYGVEDASDLNTVDITSGEAEIVGLEPVRRKTNPNVVAGRTAPSSVSGSVVGVASLAIAPTDTSTPVGSPRSTINPGSLESVATDGLASSNTTGQGGGEFSPGEPSVNYTNPVNSSPRRVTTTSSMPNVSAAAQMALFNFAQNRGGSSAKQNLGNSRTYMSAVRQQVDSTVSGVARQNGSAPTRSSIMLGSTRSRAQNIALTVSSAGNIRLGRPSITRSIASGNVRFQNELSEKNPSVSTARARAEGIRNESMSSTAVMNSRGGVPVPAGVTRTGRGTILRWVSRYGSRYQVQKSNDKVSWENVGAIRSSTNGADAVDISSSNFRFYRVIRVN